MQLREPLFVALVLAVFGALLLTEDDHLGIAAMLNNLRMNFRSDSWRTDLQFLARMEQENIVKNDDVTGLGIAAVLHLDGLVRADLDLVALEVTDCVHHVPLELSDPKYMNLNG